MRSQGLTHGKGNSVSHGLELGFVPSAFLDEDESFGPVQSLSESGVRKAFRRVCFFFFKFVWQLLNRFLLCRKGKSASPSKGMSR